MRPMKIALIDPALFTWPYDSALAEGLLQNGHQVTLHTRHLGPKEPGKNAAYVRETFYPGLTGAFVKRLPRPVFLILKGLLHPVGLLWLFMVLSREKPDVIHFQWTPLPVVDRLFIPLFRHLAPVVMTVHDSSPFNDNPSSRLQRVGATDIMNLFDRLIVHTEQARQVLLGRGHPQAKVKRIAHGLIGTEGISGVQPEQPDASKPVTFLLFGKLKPYKGADILIRAVAAMPAAVREKCLIRVVGKAEMDTGPLFALARELGVEKNIQWDLRFVDEEELAGIFANAGVTVMPYRQIDASGVLMVAMAVGRPIVATRTGLFAEILEDGKHGYLVPKEDVSILAKALEALTLDAALRLRMGAEVRALGAAIPSWREIAAKTEELYREALHG